MPVPKHQTAEFIVGTYRGPENEQDGSVPEYDDSEEFCKQVLLDTLMTSAVSASLQTPGEPAGVGMERQNGRWVVYIRRYDDGDEDIVITIPDDKEDALTVEWNDRLANVEVIKP